MPQLTAEIVEGRRAAEGQRAARRRGLSRAVRDARERLTSSSGLNRAFDYEVTRLFAQSRASATMALAALTAVVGFALVLWAGPARAGVWCALAAAATVAYLALCARFLALPAEGARVEAWRGRFVLAELLNGAVWGGLVLVDPALGTGAARTFVLFALLVQAGVAAVLASSLPGAVYAAMLPACLAVAYLFVPLHGPDDALMLMMSAGSGLFYVLLASRLHASALETIAFRAEKDLLIGELDEARDKSDEARRRAEESNLAKSRFLATMSHELRTPLNAILGFSEVMKAELFGPHSVAQYKDYAVDINSSGTHLLALINEILDLSRIEAGRYELNEEAVDLAGMVEEAVHMLGLRARARSITLIEAREAGLPRLWADERALRQIILNLLSNAIKFTPEGGEVRLKVGWTSGGGQYVTVKDNGPGIPEDEIATVLSSFGRGSLAIKTAEQGSGLGLPIVKGLVDLHQGGFALRSKVREGTEVIVTFPPERVMEALAALGPEKGPVERRAVRRAA